MFLPFFFTVGNPLSIEYVKIVRLEGNELNRMQKEVAWEAEQFKHGPWPLVKALGPAAASPLHEFRFSLLLTLWVVNGRDLLAAASGPAPQEVYFGGPGRLAFKRMGVAVS